jgi:hypothetical protein
MCASVLCVGATDQPHPPRVGSDNQYPPGNGCAESPACSTSPTDSPMIDDDDVVEA